MNYSSFAKKSVDLWSRANNVMSSSYIKNSTNGETELYLDISSLKYEENRVFNTESQLKLDLIQVYTARKQYIEKLDKLYEYVQSIQDKKLRSQLRELILAETEKFAFCGKQTITPN